MNRLTLGSLRARCAKAVNLCADDDRVADYVNAACERLLYEMKSTGTVFKYRVCLNEACIVWPRMIETIESFAICGRPGTVRNRWYEFLETGPGLSGETCGNGNQLIDSGEAVAFDEVNGTNKKIAVSVDVTEDTSAKILLQYYDENGKWVRTQVSGEWIDGEYITLPATGAYAYTALDVMAKGLVRVIKPVTNGVVRLWEYDATGPTYRALAEYEPSETIPVYRRSTIPGINNGGCCEREDDCGKISVTVMAKVRFIPVSHDNDFVCINHADAIRLGCQAVHMEYAEKLDDAASFWSLATRCLMKQTEHHNGHGAVVPLRVVGRGLFGAGISHPR